MDNASQHHIDDRDESITYVGQWQQKGVSQEYKSTTSETQRMGDTARITFYGSSLSMLSPISYICRKGTNISVWGTIGTAPPEAQSTYIIDEAAFESSFTGKQMPNKIQYQQKFFQSEQMPCTSHTLMITNLINGDELFLDYFLVGFPCPSASQTVSTQVSTIASVTPTRSTTPLSTPPSVSVESGTSGSKSDSDVGTIVGGVVGGIVLLLLIIFVLRRRTPSCEHSCVSGISFPSQARNSRADVHGTTIQSAGENNQVPTLSPQRWVDPESSAYVVQQPQAQRPESYASFRPALCVDTTFAPTQSRFPVTANIPHSITTGNPESGIWQSTHSTVGITFSASELLGRSYTSTIYVDTPRTGIKSYPPPYGE
ncbi:hypothetical protein B0H34DRAFT_722866 [Crassisporium funariophilum]|nr:hypothetical protein B0H34DRAFT_722866 [Crassisporium funariophilum]